MKFNKFNYKNTFLNKNKELDLEFSPAFIKTVLEESANPNRKTYTTKELRVELGL